MITTVNQGTQGSGQAAQFQPCKTLTVYSGTDPSFAANLNGAMACPGIVGSLVRIKTNAMMGQQLCMVPSGPYGNYQETCFNNSGQIDLMASSSDYTAIALVRASDLTAYTQYIQGNSSTYPPVAFAIVR